MLVKTSFLNTFETPLGRYRFSRMLFGIAQATKTGERRKQLQSWKENKSRRFTRPTHKLLDHNRKLAVDG